MRCDFLLPLGAHTTLATVTVDIIDANDHPPQFLATPYSCTVKELAAPGTEIFSLWASDEDQGVNKEVRGQFSEIIRPLQSPAAAYSVAVRGQLYSNKC